jgi:CRISPR-associated protein Csb3
MDEQTRETWFRLREREVDTLSERWKPLDIAMIGALGYPSYWSWHKGKLIQDWGASRWEMVPRNRGSEFVTQRLRPLASTVASKTSDAVERGLRGIGEVIDDLDSKYDSHTSTGLMPRRPTDSARAWCALWGLSLFTVTPTQKGTAKTTCHIGTSKEDAFYLPVMTEWWPLGRLRTVLRSKQLETIAKETSPHAIPVTAPAASQWLRSRGVIFVVKFPVRDHGTEKAPKRQADLGNQVFLEV